MANRLIKYKNIIRTCIIEGGFCPRYITILKKSLTNDERLDFYKETTKLINKRIKESKYYETYGYVISSLTIVGGLTISLLNGNIEWIIPVLVLNQIFLTQLNLNTNFELKELSKIKSDVLEILDDEEVLEDLYVQDK
jgi:hypothetical protein